VISKRFEQVEVFVTSAFSAVVELGCIMLDAAQAGREAADLEGRLRVWWWVATHPDRLDVPLTALPSRGAAKQGLSYDLNARQERVLSLANQHGRVTNATVHACFPLNHPETIRLDFAGLVGLGLLERHGANKGTYYVLPTRRSASRGGGRSTDEK